MIFSGGFFRAYGYDEKSEVNPDVFPYKKVGCSGNPSFDVKAANRNQGGLVNNRTSLMLCEFPSLRTQTEAEGVT